MSRKKDAESMEATANMIRLDDSEDKILIGGSADHTLPFILQIDGVKHKLKIILGSLRINLIAVNS